MYSERMREREREKERAGEGERARASGENNIVHEVNCEWREEIGSILADNFVLEGEHHRSKKEQTHIYTKIDVKFFMKHMRLINVVSIHKLY